MQRKVNNKERKVEKLKAIETLIDNALQNSYNLDLSVYLTEAKKLVREVRNEQ